MKTIYLISILLMAQLSGCVTNYQSFDHTGVGYSSEQIESDRFNVTYSGLSTSKISLVDDLVLLRSAEVALENGYSYFVVTTASHNKEMVDFSRYLSAQDTVELYDKRDALSRPNKGKIRPQSTMSILTLKEKPQRVVYDAPSIIQKIREKYNIKDNST